MNTGTEYSDVVDIIGLVDIYICMAVLIYSVVRLFLSPNFLLRRARAQRPFAYRILPMAKLLRFPRFYCQCKGQVHVPPSERHPSQRPTGLYLSAGLLVPSGHGGAHLSPRVPGHGENFSNHVHTAKVQRT